MAAPSPAEDEELEVLSLGCCLLKGSRHEPRPGTRLTAAGPEGDRRYCLVDPVRAEVLKTVRNPRLVAVRARETTTPAGRVLRLDFPDGTVAESVVRRTGEELEADYWGRPARLSLLEGPFDRAFSDYLGKRVRLAVAPPGDVVYGGAIAVACSASIEELGRRAGHPDLLAEHARFRSSLLVRTGTAFVEDDWEGQEKTLCMPDGSRTRLRFGRSLPRCAVVNLNPLTGEADASLLKELASFRPLNERGEPLFCRYAELLVG